MANKVIEMHIVRSIIQHSSRNSSERQIALQLNISRNTVRHYLQRLKATSYSWQQLSAMDDAALSELIYDPVVSPVKDERRQAFEDRVSYFLLELKRTGVTRQLLWQEYLQQYPDGYGYSQFCDLLTRHSSIKDTSMHFEHPPGQMMMVDFAGDKLAYTDLQTGEVIYCPVLVCVLPCSGYTYVAPMPDATLPQLAKSLNNCLQYFEGVPIQSEDG